MPEWVSIRLRRTDEAEPDFVLSAEQNKGNRISINQWQRR